MIEKPMLFTGPMVRAILDGRKTQTRRVVKPQPVDGDEITSAYRDWQMGRLRDSENAFRPIKCPHPIGSRIWVKETFRVLYDPATCLEGALDIDYRADGKQRLMDKIGKSKWKSPRFMPRWASRTTLEVIGVNVERLQDISEKDAYDEGIGHLPGISGKELYGQLWDSINGKKHPWVVNPWVWVYTFRKL